MLCPFKVGDRVKCINDDEGDISVKLDYIYTVESVCDEGFISLEGVYGGWYPNRFELISQEIDYMAITKSIIGG